MTKGLLPAAVVFGMQVCLLNAQSFVNLGFEQAVVQPNDPTFGNLDWNLAIPGWSHSTGRDTATVYYGSPHAGGSQYFLLVDSASGLHTPLQGRYSVAFAGGFDTTPDAWVSAYLSQSGLVPDTALSLRFLAIGDIAVTMNGSDLPIYALGGNAYAADISAYAGTVAELKIINDALPSSMAPLLVDAFVFSSTPVPEPQTIALFGLGAAGAYLLRRKRRHS